MWKELVKDTKRDPPHKEMIDASENKRQETKSYPTRNLKLTEQYFKSRKYTKKNTLKSLKWQGKASRCQKFFPKWLFVIKADLNWLANDPERCFRKSSEKYVDLQLTNIMRKVIWYRALFSQMALMARKIKCYKISGYTVF